jgi:hypothetical protein
VQGGLPVGQEIGIVALVEVGRAERRQGALEPVGLLARRAQSLARLVEDDLALAPRRRRPFQAMPCLSYAFFEASDFGAECGDLLLEVGQTGRAIALPRLVHRQIGLQRLEVLLDARETSFGVADALLGGFDGTLEGGALGLRCLKRLGAFGHVGA